MNNIKNRRLMAAMLVLSVGSVGNCFGMYMSPQSKKRFAPINVVKQQKKTTSVPKKRSQSVSVEDFMFGDELAIAQKVELLKSGQFFVYAKGTADGVVVARDVLESSPTLKDMLEDMSFDKGAIPLPFTFDAIKEVVEILSLLRVKTSNKLSPKELQVLKEEKIKKVFEELSLEQSLRLSDCFDYLGISIVFTDDNLNKYSLEDLVRFLNLSKNEKQQIMIGAKIMYWVNTIIEAMYSFADDTYSLQFGVNNFTPQTDQKIKKLFAQYHGPKIEMIPGLPYLIPNYTVLKYMDSRLETLIKNNTYMEGGMVRQIVCMLLNFDSLLPKETFVFPQQNLSRAMKEHFKQVRMVDFLNVLLQRMHDEYYERASYLGRPKAILRSIFQNK